MELLPTDIPEVLRVRPVRHTDSRGFFSEAFRSEWFPDLRFVQDNHSASVSPGTLRGLHVQAPPHAHAKLVRVTRGRILDIAVDIRVGSPTYGRYVSAELSAGNWEQLLVPVGFAHGFITREPDTEVLYKVTDYFSPDHHRGISWNDPDLAIDWGTDSPILSDGDRSNPRLSELPVIFRYDDPS